MESVGAFEPEPWAELAHHLPSVARLVEDGVGSGCHIGAQLHVSIDGEVVASAAYGRRTRTEPMLRATPMLWLCGTKPIVALVVVELACQDRLDLDQSVDQLVPEFVPGRVSGVTFRHLLTHTAGLRDEEILPFSYSPWETVIAEVCRRPVRPGWQPGQMAEYCRMASWFVLGEAIQRVTGMPLSIYLRDRVFDPLGMDACFVGLTREAYRHLRPTLGLLHSTERDVALPLSLLDNRRTTQLCNPGMGGRGPAQQLGRFYEALLSPPPASPFSDEAIALATRTHRSGMVDVVFDDTVDWGLGLVTDPRHFGPPCGPGTFGHRGFRTLAAFADPQHGLVVASIFNGLPTDEIDEQRHAALVTGIYDDLGLVRAGGDRRDRQKNAAQ